jgi:predicted component of type VI protein secretion system
LSELEELHEKLEAVNEHFTVIESQTGEGFASTTEWLGNYTDKVFKSIATKIDEKNKELRKEIFARIDAHKPLNNTKEIQDYVSASIAHIENLMKQKEEVENSNKEKAESLLSELKENITEMIDEIRNPKEKEEPKGKWDDAIEELLGKQNKQKPQGRWDEQILKLV